MLDATMLAELRAAKATWKCVPEHGYLLTSPGDPKVGPHRMGGTQSIRGADCPNCKKPLLRVLTIDTSRSPFALTPSPPKFIHLLYCWTCAIPYGPLAYRLETDGAVELIEYLKEYDGVFGPEGPYDGYTGKFREVCVGLEALTEEEEELALLVWAGAESPPGKPHLGDIQHQIGGFPTIFNPQEPNCPGCGAPAPFLATICDNAEGQGLQEDVMKTFTDNCGVQMVFHYCGPCRVITAYHSCD